MQHTITAKKLITAIIATTLLLSFSPVSVFASCSPDEQYQIETEIRMMESILSAPSPAQRRENSLNRINEIAKTHTTNEKDVQGLILNHYPEILSFETIRHIDFETEIVDPSNIENGRAELHTATLYEDGATGYSVDGFDFNIEDGEVTHFELDPLVPEAAIQAAREEAKNFTPSEPTVEKKVVQEPKQPTPLPPIEDQLTPQEIHEGAKVSAKETKEELEVRKDSNCTIVVSAASGGAYDRKKAVEYARKYAENYNPDYPDYNKPILGVIQQGGDCTNFASQVVQAGGLVQDSGYGKNFLGVDDESDTRNWYIRKNWLGQFEHSKSWTSVNHFLDHMKQHENTSELLDFQKRGFRMFEEMEVGDLVFADLDVVGTKNHAMIITGWDRVYGLRQPRLTYHTSDTDDISFKEFRLRDEDGLLYGMKINSPIR